MESSTDTLIMAAVGEAGFDTQCNLASTVKLNEEVSRVHNVNSANVTELSVCNYCQREEVKTVRVNRLRSKLPEAGSERCLNASDVSELLFKQKEEIASLHTIIKLLSEDIAKLRCEIKQPRTNASEPLSLNVPASASQPLSLNVMHTIQPQMENNDTDECERYSSSIDAPAMRETGRTSQIRPTWSDILQNGMKRVPVGPCNKRSARVEHELVNERVTCVKTKKKNLHIAGRKRFNKIPMLTTLLPKTVRRIY